MGKLARDPLGLAGWGLCGLGMPPTNAIRSHGSWGVEGAQ